MMPSCQADILSPTMLARLFFCLHKIGLAFSSNLFSLRCNMSNKEGWMNPLFFRAGIGLVCALLVTGCLSRQAITVNEKPSKKSEVAHASGGNGDSYETSVVITGGKDYTDAVDCEYGFVANAWGVKDKDWKLVEKTTMVENGRTYDMMQVEIPKVGEKHFYYFDITHYKKKRKSAEGETAKEPGETPKPDNAQRPLQTPEPTPVAQSQLKRDSAQAQQPAPAQEPKASQDTSTTPENK
jgi:hypothetical protein